MRKFYSYFPAWLIGALLYGLSWNECGDFNLSYLAWFAFVPLFYSLENENSFFDFYRKALWYCFIANLIISYGFFITPKKQIFAFLAVIVEIITSSVSFALLYPLKKKFGFKTALLVFPFLIAGWEWLYPYFDHSFGCLMIAHSQCHNTAFIQCIDLLGSNAISCWVMAFNVLIFFEYKRFHQNLWSFIFLKKIAIIFVAMIAPLSFYSMIRYSQIQQQIIGHLNITLIHSNFSVLMKKNDEKIIKIQRLTQITDSVDVHLKELDLSCDLYVWHEAAIESVENYNSLIEVTSSVERWKTPLLTGAQLISEKATMDDRRKANLAILIPFSSSGQTTFSTYDKMRLAPGHEMIPYHKWLSKIPKFPVSLNDSSFLKAGTTIKLIELMDKKGNVTKIGTPICIEQDFPAIWSEMAMKGASCFIQISFESWWSLGYFQKQMANITKLRCIETRRATARCSNGGITEFIDAFGRVYALARTNEGAITAELPLIQEISFYSAHPYLFPCFCLIISVLICIFRSLKMKIL